MCFHCADIAAWLDEWTETDVAGVNLKRIAEVAGVSPATASRVLSGSDYPVKQHLRERILAAASELNYVPNAAAQGLLRGRSMTVGVLVGDVSDPFFSGMIGGIHEGADEIDHMVNIVNTYRDPEAEITALRRLHAHRVDILILAGSGLREPAYHEQLVKNLTSFTAAGKSAVVVGRHDLPDELPLSTIEIDNREGGRLVAEHLSSLGHERVVLLTGDQRLNSTSDRIRGFADVYGDQLTTVSVPPTRDGGHDAVEAILREHPRTTAISATADQMAFGVLVALRERGIRVPDDISVSGFNDIDMSRDLVPSLTSVHLPLREAGKRALQIGYEALTGGPQRVHLDLALAARDSTATAATA